MDHIVTGTSCDAGGRGGETALPVPSIGDCDRVLLHVGRVRCLGGHCGQEGSSEALWGMWCETLHNSAGRTLRARWALSSAVSYAARCVPQSFPQKLSACQWT